MGDGYRKTIVPEVSDLIVEHVHEKLRSGAIAPGDRLPSETRLAQLFGVKRGRVREAIRKLERFGVVRTSPQSGTYVNTFGKKTLSGIITNHKKAGDAQSRSDDYRSLVYVRTILERCAAELAAERWEPGQLAELETLHEELKEDIQRGGRAMDENLAFHLKIVECSNSPYLISQITILIPSVMELALEFDNHLGAQPDRFARVAKEHEEILTAIRERNPQKASQSMESHIQQSLTTLDAMGFHRVEAQ